MLASVIPARLELEQNRRDVRKLLTRQRELQDEYRVRIHEIVAEVRRLDSRARELDQGDIR